MSQLIMYGIVMRMAAFLRPILSAMIPEGTAPTIAPIANSEAIHVNCSVVAKSLPPAPGSEPSASKPFGKTFGDSSSFTGDVHDRPVPAAAALRHTIGDKRKKANYYDAN